MNSRISRLTLAFLAAAALAAPGLALADSTMTSTTRTTVTTTRRSPGVVFKRRPAWVVIPETRYHYIADYTDADVYEAGGRWYVYRDGTWWLARTYRGPWRTVTAVKVPRGLVNAGTGYYHIERTTTTTTP